jgi:hypothetical protein
MQEWQTGGLTAYNLFYWRCGDGMKVIEMTLGYYKGSPVMVLKPAGADNKKRFIIKLEDLWKYSDTHNEMFESFIANKVIQICALFEITVPKGEKAFAQMMASMAGTIMDGIDDLVKMPPYRAGHDDPDTVIDMPQPSDMPDIRVGMMH